MTSLHDADPRSYITDAVLAHASATVRTHLSATPLVSMTLGGTPLLLKLETLQPTGSFKVRGALAAVDAYAGAGDRIVTASAGNHGLGIAHAASVLGVEATVVVPRTASPAKVAALRELPVELVQYGDAFDEAEAHALRLAGEGGRYVSAYDDPYVIAGQGTILDELIDVVDGDLHVIVPVGGGGLAAGVGLRAALVDREVRVTGVEASRSRAVSTAVERGEVVTVPVGDTIADGLAGNIGADTRTPHLIHQAGVQLAAAPETAIRAAVAELALAAGIVAEGSAAVGLAAIREGSVPVHPNTVLVVTGRNISAATLLGCLRA